MAPKVLCESIRPGLGSTQEKRPAGCPRINERNRPPLPISAIQKPTGVRQREPDSEKRAKVQKLGASAVPAENIPAHGRGRLPLTTARPGSWRR